MNTSYQYKNLVIAFVAALIWNHRGNPGGKAAGDDLADDIETAFLRLSVALPSKNAWLEAEELRAQAFAEALALRDAEKGIES